jgi:hypothetical protein
MDQKELVFNIVHTAKAAVNYKLPIVHSTVNIATGRNKPPIAPQNWDGSNPEKDFKD